VYSPVGAGGGGGNDEGCGTNKEGLSRTRRDDHVMLGYEDESVGESDATWSDDDEPDLAALESYGTALVIGPCDTPVSHFVYMY